MKSDAPSSRVCRFELLAGYLAGILIFFVAAILLFVSCVASRKGNDSKNWGVVIGTLSEAHHSGDGSGHSAVRYQYSYGGSTFETDRVGFGFSSARAAPILLGKKTGDQILVYVNSQSPTESVLVTGADPRMKAVAALSGFAIILALVILGMTIRLHIKQRNAS